MSIDHWRISPIDPSQNILGLGITQEVGNLGRVDIEISKAMEKISPCLSPPSDIDLIALGINYRSCAVGGDLRSHGVNTSNYETQAEGDFSNKLRSKHGMKEAQV